MNAGIFIGCMKLMSPHLLQVRGIAGTALLAFGVSKSIGSNTTLEIAQSFVPQEEHAFFGIVVLMCSLTASVSSRDKLIFCSNVQDEPRRGAALLLTLMTG